MAGAPDAQKRLEEFRGPAMLHDPPIDDAIDVHGADDDAFQRAGTHDLLMVPTDQVLDVLT